MKTVLPLVLSMVTVLGMWRVGRKRWDGWLIGVANQGLWLLFIAWYRAWGLLPLSGTLIVVYTRNMLLWRQEPAT